MNKSSNVSDIFVIGGGINGTGIARDASGRGLNVTLAEKGDLAIGTSSASTKLFHGGLRYLEYFEIRLVREALQERETLLSAMPHISWPMRFVLPLSPKMRFESSTPVSRVLSKTMPWLKGRRPDWLIRIGLLLYDSLGGRKVLPATRTLDLRHDPAGKALQPQFHKAYEYSDCWIEDSRLVVLNARDAAIRGAQVMTRTKVTAAKREGSLWRVTTETTDGQTATHYSRSLINAAGPWVSQVINNTLQNPTKDSVRLVRGSHIVTRKLYDHDRCYFFQGSDGRIIFAIPYEEDFTLIGTTDQDQKESPENVAISDSERDYLLNFASQYFRQPVTVNDIVWTYSGIRPLYDDGASSASSATRDYVLKLDTTGAPLLNIFGGKITTYRRLAESSMEMLLPLLGSTKPKWTAGIPLPGGDFPLAAKTTLVQNLQRKHAFLTPEWAARLIRAYGTDAEEILGQAVKVQDLGQDFGATLTETEVRWMMSKEWAYDASDVLWRRSKLGLRVTAEQVRALDAWMSQQRRV